MLRQDDFGVVKTTTFYKKVVHQPYTIKKGQTLLYVKSVHHKEELYNFCCIIKEGSLISESSIKNGMYFFSEYELTFVRSFTKKEKLLISEYLTLYPDDIW